MRLVCPNCGAQYEVPKGVIPDDGRDVQCSNCGNTWFEPHPDAVATAEAARDAELAPPPPPPAPDPEPRMPDPRPQPRAEPRAEPQPESRPEPRPDPRGVDPNVADVLRGEAEFEARARAAETGGALESQPDLGLDETSGNEDQARRAQESQDRMSRMRGDTGQIETAVATTLAAEADRPRREQLPDIEDINATLRSTKEPRITDRAEAPPHIQAAETRRRGFRRGFFLMVLVAVILVALYVFAPRIAEALPALKGPLDQYVALVDQGRIWLDQQIGAGLQWLDSMASEASAGDNAAETETDSSN